MDFRSRSRSRSGSRSRSRERERKRRGYYIKREPKERFDYEILRDLRQENDHLRKRLEMLEKNQQVKVRFSRGFQTEDVQLISRSTSPNCQQHQIDQGSQTDPGFKALDGILDLWKNYSSNTDASTNTDEKPEKMQIKVCKTREVGTETEEMTNSNLVNMENGKIVNKNVFQPQQGRAVGVTEKVKQTDEIEKDEQRDRRHGQGHRIRIMLDIDKNQFTPTTATQQVQNRFINDKSNANNGLSRGPSAEVNAERNEFGTSSNTGNFTGAGGMARNPIFSPCSSTSSSREAVHNAGVTEKGSQVGTATAEAETGNKEQGDRDRRQSHIKNGDQFHRNMHNKSQPATAPQKVQNRSPEPASTYRIPKYNNDNPNANAYRVSRGRSESEDNGRRVNCNFTDGPIIVSTRSLSFSDEILKQMELAETANHKKNSASALSGSGADVNKQDQAREGNSNAENIKKYNQNSPNKAETTRCYGYQKKEYIKEERNNLPNNPLFKCLVEACGRIFVHESQLLFHNQHSHSNGEKKLLCFYCKKKFRVEDRFNNHVKKRLGTYQKGCWRCKKGFSCQDNWRIHNDLHLNRILKTSCSKNKPKYK